MEEVSTEATAISDEKVGIESQRQEVSRYQASWNCSQHSGKITLFDPFFKYITTKYIDSPSEYSVVVELLRYEKPLYYSSSSGEIFTGSGEQGEIVGEEES